MAQWILLGLLGVVLLALFCPLGVEVLYRNEAPRVRLRLLGIWKQLLPAKEKPARKTKEKKQKPTPEKEKPEKKQTPMPLMDILQAANDLLPAIGKALGSTLRHITVRRFRARITIQGEDAADTGTRYGQMSALCYNGYALLASYLRVKEWKLALVPDFTEQTPLPPELELYLTASPAILLYLAIRLLTSGLVTLSQVKQQLKQTKTKKKRR